MRVGRRRSPGLRSPTRSLRAIGQRSCHRARPPMRSESVTCWHGSRVIDSAGLTPLNAGPIRDAQHETPALLPLGVARRLILGLPGAEKNAEMRCDAILGGCRTPVS
jgi:hypothetical protein